jgi:hypothetical protein
VKKRSLTVIGIERLALVAFPRRGLMIMNMFVIVIRVVRVSM